MTKVSLDHRLANDYISHGRAVRQPQGRPKGTKEDCSLAHKENRHRSSIQTIAPSGRMPGGSVVPLRDPAQHASPVPVEAMDQVRQAIERESTKTALERAKELHKRLGTPESESLLIEAYAARIKGMMAKGMVPEAKALADLVVHRFPACTQRLQEVVCSLACKTGDLASLVLPLADPDLPATQKGRIEETIRRDLTDLGDLAACQALAQDHPLRRAATALCAAFQAVTSEPVDEAILGLPEVSHRSPLAPWKHLIRAIARMYQGQDQACRQALEAVDKDSAAAGLAGVIRCILDAEGPGGLGPAAMHLVDTVSNGQARLRLALRQLDLAFQDDGHKGIQDRIREALSLCEQARPDLLERLKQHVSAKAVVAEVPVGKVMNAFGGRALHDAYFWRLLARAMETRGDTAYTCALWDRFLCAAGVEGTFNKQGPEAAFLYRHMADLLVHIRPGELRMLQAEYEADPPDWWDFYVDQPPRIQEAMPDSDRTADLYYIHPERLYARACAIRPDGEVYGQWLDYAHAVQPAAGRPDDVASQWARSFPTDARPLLYLAAAAEQRDAFDKALRYVGQAEQVGSLDPEVRQARFRLLRSKALRHIQKGKLDLASKGLDELDCLPQAKDRDRPAFVMSLRWIYAAVARDQDLAARVHQDLAVLLGGLLPADLLLESTARECRYSGPLLTTIGHRPGARNETDLLAAVARIWRIGIDVDLPIRIPHIWRSALTKAVKAKSSEVPGETFLTLGEAALDMEWNDLAFLCSRHGLSSQGPALARFLFLRARSLPEDHTGRSQDCLAAAAELARRARDQDLLAEIVDEMRMWQAADDPFGPAGPYAEDLTMPEDRLQAILQDERRLTRYPRHGASNPYGEGPVRVLPRVAQRGMDRPRRYGSRRKRQEDANQGVLFEDLFDPEGDEDTEVPLDGPVPHEFVELMARVMQLNRGRMPTSKELERLLREHPDVMDKMAKLFLKYRLDDPPRPHSGPQSWPGRFADIFKGRHRP